MAGKPRASHWYWGIACEKCGSLIVLWTDRDAGQVDDEASRFGTVKGNCRNGKCRHVGQYPYRLIRRFEGRAEVRRG